MEDGEEKGSAELPFNSGSPLRCCCSSTVAVRGEKIIRQGRLGSRNGIERPSIIDDGSIVVSE